jgi:pimeloyl-ACP methyl ester carboxylesterase
MTLCSAFWALRVFARPLLERIAGIPAGYVVTAADRPKVTGVLDSFFPFAPRARGTIWDGYVGNPDIATYPFEQVSVPTLVVHGKDDPLASHDDARAMAGRIPGARFISIDRGGHILTADDHDARAVSVRGAGLGEIDVGREDGGEHGVLIVERQPVDVSAR